MNKYKITYNINNDLKSHIIKKEEDKFVVNESDVITTIIIKKNKVILKRETNEYYFIVDFIKKTCIYKLKDYNLIMNISVNYANFSVNDNCIIMDYKLESNDKNIIIKIERMI